MNRGRHKTNKIIKLLKKNNAQCPELWDISLEDLNNLINTQKKYCGFNDLHIFETHLWATSLQHRGGFNWYDTKEGSLYWEKIFHKIYTNIYENLKK